MGLQALARAEYAVDDGFAGQRRGRSASFERRQELLGNAPLALPNGQPVNAQETALAMRPSAS